jgi:hypothetical protein
MCCPIAESFIALISCRYNMLFFFSFCIFCYRVNFFGRQRQSKFFCFQIPFFIFLFIFNKRLCIVSTCVEICSLETSILYDWKFKQYFYLSIVKTVIKYAWQNVKNVKHSKNVIFILTLGLIQSTLFSSQLIDGLFKLEC